MSLKVLTAKIHGECTLKDEQRGLPMYLRITTILMKQLININN